MSQICWTPVGCDLIPLLGLIATLVNLLSIQLEFGIIKYFVFKVHVEEHLGQVRNRGNLVICAYQTIKYHGM